MIHFLKKKGGEKCLFLLGHQKRFRTTVSSVRGQVNYIPVVMACFHLAVIKYNNKESVRTNLPASPSFTHNLTFLHSRHFQPFLPSSALHALAHNHWRCERTKSHAMMTFPLPHTHLQPYVAPFEAMPCMCVSQ